MKFSPECRFGEVPFDQVSKGQVSSTNISENSITVETTAKKPVTVEVSDKTKFEKSGSPATLKELKVGDKVVVHADSVGDKLVASEVNFGMTKKMQPMKGMGAWIISEIAVE